MKTYMMRVEDVKREWYIVDAKNKILGRLATKIANTLRGKTKAEFTPHVDMGDGVIVINAEKIQVTGNKLEAKKYQRYSGYPGGQKEVNLEKMLATKPEEVIMHAVKGMLPHNILGRRMLKRLKVYAKDKHLHEGQNPKELKI